MGHWKLNDTFEDISTENTEFVFLNPTKLTLTLDYAFFANPPEADQSKTPGKIKGAVFCGCDEDTLIPNGRVRYTMAGEEKDGFLSRKLCPNQTDGVMKTIVFTSKKEHPDQINIDDALQAGYQSQTFNKGQGRTEADLKAVPITEKTKEEIQFIHEQCSKFLKKIAANTNRALNQEGAAGPFPQAWMSARFVRMPRPAGCSFILVRMLLCERRF